MEYYKIKSGLWLIVFILAVVVLVSWSLNRNAMTSEQSGKLVCVTAKQGEIEQGVRASGVIIRDEMVYISPVSGVLRLVASEKDRTRTDTVIAQVELAKTQGRRQGNMKIDLVAERPGVVSFALDGLERTLTPSSWVDFDAKKVSKLVSEPVSQRSGMEVDIGQPLFRVVDNYRIYVLLFPEPGIMPSVSESLTEGRRCSLRFDSVAGSRYSAKIASRVNATEDDSRPDALLLELTDFPGELYYLRHVQAKLITKTQRGLIIPKQALVKSENGYLVYIPANLGVDSKLVEVVASDESQVMCEGLREGQRVVVNPYLIHEAGITVWK